MSHFFDATATTVRKWIRKRGHFAHFVPRSKMARKYSARSMAKGFVAPTTPLPCDCTGNATVSCPMDGNDTYGICGPAMCAHVHGILTYAQGQRTEDVIQQTPLITQYLKISGGDNGTNESMLVGPQGIWTTAGGGIAGDTTAIIADSLDIPADAGGLEYAIDQFYAVEMAWSVPDAFLSEFSSGASFLSPMTPDPENGHYTPLSDLDASGNFRLWTWGGWCWVSNSFVQSVDPVFFVVFSPRQFDLTTGYDSKGRHITTQAAVWQSMGGGLIPASIIDAFPPIGGPVPTPTPAPIPVPAPVPMPVPAPPPFGLFTLTVGRSVQAGRVVEFRAPTTIPAGMYSFVPVQSHAVELKVQ